MVLTSIIIGLGITHILVLSRVLIGEHRRSRGFIPQGRMALCISGGCDTSGLHSRVDPRLRRWSSIEKHPRSFLMAVVFLLWLVIVGFEIIPQPQFSVGWKHHQYLSKILRWKMSTFVIAISYLAMALAALAMEFAFHILGLVTSGRFIGPTARIFSWP